MRKTILLTGALALTMTVSAQTEVVQGVMRGKDYGVTYALPKSAIKVEAKINKVQYTPGELAKYANRYLRLNNVSTEPADYYELTGIVISSIGIPDKDNVYFVKMKDRTVAPMMELTNDGIIKSINVPTSNQKQGSNSNTNTNATSRKALNPNDFLTEEILMASSSAKVAELIAKEIYSIRESKNALVRGQADFMPKDGEQMRIMLETLEDQEKALTEMFTGKYIKTEQNHIVLIEPEGDIDKEVAFRFSSKLGAVSNDDLSGDPVYISLRNLNTIDIPTDNNKKKVEGVAYNVPGKAIVTLTQNGKTIVEEEMPVTQFGIVEYLAPALFNKNSTIQVTFNPNTGGLVKVDREEGK